MKLLYENLLNMDKMDLNREHLSAMMQALSKLIVPARILDHSQVYELEIGDVVYLDYVALDEYQVKRLTNVIDQLGDEPEHPEWKHIWHHNPCKTAESDGITRCVSEQVLLKL
jgi:hypothetical protein